MLSLLSNLLGITTLSRLSRRATLDFFRSGRSSVVSLLSFGYGECVFRPFVVLTVATLGKNSQEFVPPPANAFIRCKLDSVNRVFLTKEINLFGKFE